MKKERKSSIYLVLSFSVWSLLLSFFSFPHVHQAYMNQGKPAEKVQRNKPSPPSTPHSALPLSNKQSKFPTVELRRKWLWVTRIVLLKVLYTGLLEDIYTGPFCLVIR